MFKQMKLFNTHLPSFYVATNSLSNKVYLLISIKIFVFKFQDELLLLNEKIICNASFNGNESVRCIQDNKSIAITEAVLECVGFFLLTT